MGNGGWRKPGALGVTVVVTAAAVIGAVVLGRALTVWIPVGIAVFALIATWRTVGRRVLEAACAAVVALLVLVSFAAGIRLVLDLQLPIAAGLG